MRRRRLPSRRSGRNTSLALREQSSDLRYLEEVVTIQFPINSARVYLQRSMGNRIGFQLVEAERGETLGTVRCVEIRHVNSGEKTWVFGDRLLANGEPASFFVPDHLVQVQARIQGSASVSRTLSLDDEVILHVPVRGYLRFLPAIFQGECPVHSRELINTRDSALQKWGSGLPRQEAIEGRVNEDPMRRYLFIFQHMMTSITDRLDRINDLTDPLLCEPKFLPWLASWVGFELDESLPVNQQRELVRRAIRLYRTRGTRGGIEEMVRVLTSAPVRVQERVRPKPVALGKGFVIGGQDVVERYYRSEPVGCFLMEPAERSDTSFFTLKLEPRERFRGRFGERAAQVLRRIVDVVSQERPTHVAFTIKFDERR